MNMSRSRDPAITSATFRLSQKSRRTIPNRRLHGVSYGRCKPVLFRLCITRFHYYVSPVTTLCAPLQRVYVTKLLRSFQPEAVITVVWNYIWATAAAYAERARLPLHLIV